MARMLPAVIDPTCRSPGERDLFLQLRDDPVTDGWTVLHSLDLAEHPRQVVGEADFVVIIPGKGILCLEVKACRTLRRDVDQGLWYYGSSATGDPRGPFRQAAGALHAIHDHLAKNGPELARIPIWSAVVFPYLNFAENSAEWQPWEVIDQPKLRLHSMGYLCMEVMDKARAHLAAKSSFDPTRPVLDPAMCKFVERVLRPSFEVLEPPRNRLQREENEVYAYTAEQLACLDALSANPRVIFPGPAGTGKTVLAIESARREAKLGHRVLLVCFNRLLGQWMAEQVASQALITCQTLPAYMVHVSGVDVDETGKDQEFWNRTLPGLALEAMMKLEQFDALVVDEGQDLLKEANIDVLDLAVKGGLRSGRWRLFGDFAHQRIFAGDLTIESFQEKYGLTGVPRYELTINCRNTPRIAKRAEALGHLAPGYSKYLRPDDGVEPRFAYYGEPASERALLARVVAQLQDEGRTLEEIVILSARAAEKSIARELRDLPTCGIEGEPGKLRCGSVWTFKGMEAPVVIVTDVDSWHDTRTPDLLYTASTRARQELVVLVNKAVRAELERSTGLNAESVEVRKGF